MRRSYNTPLSTVHAARFADLDRVGNRLFDLFLRADDVVADRPAEGFALAVEHPQNVFGGLVGVGIPVHRRADHRAQAVAHVVDKAVGGEPV